MCAHTPRWCQLLPDWETTQQTLERVRADRRVFQAYEKQVVELCSLNWASYCFLLCCIACLTAKQQGPGGPTSIIGGMSTSSITSGTNTTSWEMMECRIHLAVKHITATQYISPCKQEYSSDDKTHGYTILVSQKGTLVMGTLMKRHLAHKGNTLRKQPLLAYNTDDKIFFVKHLPSHNAYCWETVLAQLHRHTTKTSTLPSQQGLQTQCIPHR